MLQHTAAELLVAAAKLRDLHVRKHDRGAEQMLLRVHGQPELVRMADRSSVNVFVSSFFLQRHSEKKKKKEFFSVIRDKV